MKKIIILLVLCLGVLGFSANNDSSGKKNTIPGFENLVWEMSKNEVIEKLGKPSSDLGNSLFYNNQEFIGLRINVEFKFKDGELFEWKGEAKTSEMANLELLSTYMSKYKKGTTTGSSAANAYMFLNEQRDSYLSVFFYNKEPARVSFRYSSPKEYDRVIQKEKEEELKREKEKKDILNKI